MMSLAWAMDWIW